MANNSNNWKNSSNNENVPAALKNINMPGMSQSKHNDVSGLHQPSTGLSSDDGLDNTPSIEEGQNNNMMPGGNLNNPLNGDMPGNEEAKSKLGKNNNFLPNSFGNQQQNMPEEDDSTKSGSQMFMDGAKKLANTAMGIGGMGGSQNNEDLPASVKITQKAKKWIKIMQFIAPVLPYIGIIFIVMIVAYMIIIQLAILKEKITLTLNNGVIAVTTFHEKYLNFFSGKGWRTEEDVFFKELIDRYEQGKSISPSMGGPIELDVPLLLSTINYSKVIDPSIHEVGGQDKVTDCPENNPDCDTEKDDSAIESSQTFWEGYLQVKQIRNFYYVANDKLGSIFTLVPGQRRLLGHMVTWKVGISTGTMSEAVQGWVDLLRLLGFITSDTVSDIWDIIFIFDEFEKMKAYAAQGKNHDSYTEYGERNYFYEVEEIISMCGEVVKEFYDFISGKSKDASEEEKSLWSTIPYPKVTIKLDNEYRPRSDGDYGYAEYLRRVYVPGNFFSDPKGEKYSQEALDIIVRDIFAQKRQYDEFMEGFGSTDGSSTGGGTNCEYDLTPKVNIGGNLSSYGDEYKSVSNIKVRLMECNTSGRPSATEELIDFEYYIMGVSYAEIGPDAPVEAIKAQAVAARSYSLIRGAAMNQPSFSNIKKTDEGWIISIRNCTQDQVYCDPDRGCYTDNAASALVISGEKEGRGQWKPKLPEDAPLRNAVKETAGEILIDKDNYVTIGEYVDSTEQQPWIREANNGKLYHDILTSHYSKKYNTAITVGSGKCQTPSAETGDWAAWRQYDPKWGNQKLCASATISKSGCAMTATAMQLARSGVSYTVNGELNPGTFVEAMQKNGGETNCNIVWGAVTNIAPGLKYDPNWAIAFKSSTTDKEKYDTVSKAIDAGCYVVLEVDRFNGKGHWVAVTGTDNGEIKMADPAGDTTDVFSKYGKGPSEIVCYKKTG